jgi:hypothetical protein
LPGDHASTLNQPGHLTMAITDIFIKRPVLSVVVSLLIL